MKIVHTSKKLFIFVFIFICVHITSSNGSTSWRFTESSQRIWDRYQQSYSKLYKRTLVFDKVITVIVLVQVNSLMHRDWWWKTPLIRYSRIIVHTEVRLQWVMCKLCVQINLFLCISDVHNSQILFLSLELPLIVHYSELNGEPIKSCDMYMYVRTRCNG